VASRRDVVIQMGHVARRRGFTGTSGWGHTEQEFVRSVGARLNAALRNSGFKSELIGADDPVPDSRVFMALHQDGSTSSAARGASVGYPDGAGGERIAQLWKAYYAKAGWPSGFRPDNYTPGLRRYYGFRRSSADAKFLIEHGFATNQHDQRWMWDHLDEIALVGLRTVTHFLRPQQPIDPSVGEEEDDMYTLIDTSLNKGWVVAGNKARPLSNLASWLADWQGVTHSDDNMRYIVASLYQEVS